MGVLRVCEKMGTGSRPLIQNPDDINDWPVPVPIFSQTLIGGQSSGEDFSADGPIH